MPRRSSRRIASPRLRNRLRCEALEDRRLLATYVVSSTADAGAGSLREAIDLANATATIADEIVFDETVFATPQAILLESQLPTITDALSIVGPGAELLALDAQKQTLGSAAPYSILVADDAKSSTKIDVSISGVTLRNVADRPAIWSVESLTVTDGNFIDNGQRYNTSIATLFGGAINNSGLLTVVGSNFQGNHAGSGGAISSSGMLLSVTSSYFKENQASSGGGAILSNSTGGFLTISGNTFAENLATGSSSQGGAVYVSHGPNRASIETSTFSRNEAGQGGAIFNAGYLALSHSTVYGSRVGFSVGVASAITSSSQGRVSIDHSIVAGTEERGSGALRQDLYRVLDVTNSLIGFDDQLPFNGLVLIDGENGNQIGGEQTPFDPRLAPLADHGGPTPTHAPLPGSRVIDAGDADYVAAPGETDQRGGLYQRVVSGRIDIGAFESQGPVTTAPGDFNGDGRFDAADYTVWRDSEGTSVAPLTAGDATGDGAVDETDRQLWASRYGDRYLLAPPVVNSLNDNDDGDIFNDHTTLREAIRFANESYWVDVITFDPSLSGGVIIPFVSGGFGGTQSPAYQIGGPLTIDASMLEEGITIGFPSDPAPTPAAIFRIGEQAAPPEITYDVTFRGLTIRGGGFYAAIDGITLGDLTLDDVTIVDSYGAGVTNWGAIFLVDSVVEDVGANQFFGGVGAIHSKTAVHLLRSEVLNARKGGVYMIGAGFAGETGYEPEVVLVDSRVDGVTVSTAPEGRAVSGSVVRLENSHVTQAAAGGVYGGNVTLVSSSITGVTAGAAVSGQRVSLVDSVVKDNTSSSGATNSFFESSGVGVAATESVTLIRSRVENNQVTGASAITYGGGVYSRGTVSLLDSFVEGNSATYGGGIYAAGRTLSGGYLPVETVVSSIVGSSVSGNAATRDGAAVYSRGSFVVDTSSVSSNVLPTYYYGGSFRQAVIAIDSPFTFNVSPTVSIVDTVLASNLGAPSPPPGADMLSPSAVLYGPGSSVNNVTLIRTHVIDNEMHGVFATSIIDSVISRNAGFGATVSEEVRGSTISANRDGGLVGRGGPIVVSDSVIRGNSTTFNLASQVTAGVAGQYAAGVNHLGGPLLLERSVVAENHLTYLPSSGVQSYAVAGGVSASNLVVIDSMIRENTIEGFGVTGGGVAVFGTGDARFYRSTVSGNRAIGEGARGGGVYSADIVDLIQSTISGNSAEGAGAAGGGVYTKILNATHSTIADNATDSIGGGVYVTDAVSMEGTIVAGNTAADGGPDFYRTGTGILTVNYSLLGDAADSGVDAATGSGNLLNVDPLLGSLQDNGGLTWTHALLPGSPAIDAGDPTRTAVPWSISGFSSAGNDDQRGNPFPRVLDGGSGILRIDMGAVEAKTPIAPVFIGIPPKTSIEPMTAKNESSLSLPESYDRALAEFSARRASLLIELNRLNAFDSNESERFELFEVLEAADHSQETIDNAVRAQFSS